MDARTYVSGKYMVAVDLPTDRHVVAVITDVTEETMELSHEDKLVPTMRGANGKKWPKPYVPNVTSLKDLITAFGHNTDLWIGCSIEMWQGTRQFGGKTVPSIYILALNGVGASQSVIERRTDTDHAINDREPAPVSRDEPSDMPGGRDLDDKIPFGPCVQ